MKTDTRKIRLRIPNALNEAMTRTCFIVVLYYINSSQ